MRHTLALVLLVACSASPALAPRDCTPGATVACACPGASGVQTCGADGTLGACVCADAGIAEDARPAAVDAPSVPDVGADAGSPALDAPGPQDRPQGPDAAETGSGMPDATQDTGVPCEPRNVCGSVCVEEYLTDPQNCGACFIRCAPRAVGAVPACSGGVCVLRCGEGLVACGVDRCVSPLAPSFDCQQCGYSCPDGQRCDYDGRRGRCVPR